MSRTRARGPAPVTVYWVTLSDGPRVHVSYDQRHTLCGRDIPALRFDGTDRTDVSLEIKFGVPLCRDCHR